MRRAFAVALAAVAVLATAKNAAAQTDASRVEVSGGVRWIGQLNLADNPANEMTLGGGNRALFESKTTLDDSVGGTATIGVRVSQLFRVEGAVVFSPTQLSTRVTEDAEGVADTTITSPVQQLLVEGGVLVQAAGSRVRPFAPFVTAGAGYLRQLNDGRTLVETGSSYYLGGGLYYARFLSGPRRVKATGLRADVRALFMHNGVAADSDWRSAPTVTAAFFVRF